MPDSPIRQILKTEIPQPRPLVGATRACLAGGCEGQQIYGDRPVPAWRCQSCGTVELE